MDYVKEAIGFCDTHGVKIDIVLNGYGYYFDEDAIRGDKRNIYDVMIERGDITYTFSFGQSIVDTEEHRHPTSYDILSCLTKYNPGSIEDFCQDFGYDTDSRKVYKIYRDVVEEWKNVNRLFGDILDDLREIN